jgi:hypothetical protein
MSTNNQSIEHFVDADVAATFLGISARKLMEMARAGHLPAHPLISGKRNTWRFLISELREHLLSRSTCLRPTREQMKPAPHRPRTHSAH